MPLQQRGVLELIDQVMPVALTQTLVDERDLVLIGTTDGRVLTRRIGEVDTLDLCAIDCLALEEELCPQRKLGSAAIVVLRQLTADRFLTVNADGLVQLWDTKELITDIKPIEAFNLPLSDDPPMITPTPLGGTILLNDFLVLDVCCSGDGRFASLINADGEVVLISVTNGEEVTRYTPQDFNHSPATSCFFHPDGNHLLVGLYDGSVVSIPRHGFESVQSVNALAEITTVGAPVKNSRQSAVVEMAATADGNQLYFGRLDGSVSTWNVTTKLLTQGKRGHSGFVAAICVTSQEVVSAGQDRTLSWIDTPANRTSMDERALREASLPRDESLTNGQMTTAREAGDTLDQGVLPDRRSRPYRTTSNIPGVKNPADLLNPQIRNSDLSIAVLQHQFRKTYSTSDGQAILRQLEKQISGKTSAIQEPVPVDASGTTFSQVGEVNTDFIAGIKDQNRTSLSVSSDGRIIMAAGLEQQITQEKAEPSHVVNAWEVTSKSLLRKWPRPNPPDRILFNDTHQLALIGGSSDILHLTQGVREEVSPFTILSSAWGPNLDEAAFGMAVPPDTASNALLLHSTTGVKSVAGLEVLGGAVSQLAWANDGRSLLVASCQDQLSRLIEVDAMTLQVRQELYKDRLSAKWTAPSTPSQPNANGTMVIVPSKSGRTLLTWGRYADGSILRICRKAASSWSIEDTVEIRDSSSTLDLKSCGSPAVFVRDQDTRVAILTTQGVAVLNSRSGEVEKSLPIPDVAGKRPATLLSHDGSWLFGGDAEGQIWCFSLANLHQKPVQFSAHTGGIISLALSANGRYLASLGADRRIRLWNVHTEDSRNLAPSDKDK